MARARNIKPGLYRNEEMIELPIAARYLFTGLWTMADRRGRLEDRPKKIKLEILPYDDVDVDVLLDALVSKGFLIRYDSGSTRYIQIVNFEKHQNPHKNEAESTIPAPDEYEAAPDKHQTSTVQAPEESDANPADSLIPDSLIPDSSSSPNGLLQTPKNDEEKNDPPKPRSRAPDLIFDAFCDVLGFESSRLNKTERGKINTACKDVRDAGGTPDDIRLAAERYRHKWPEIDMTAIGISGNWQALLNGRGGPVVLRVEDVYKRLA